MLSRTQTVERLIRLRRQLSEDSQNSFPRITGNSPVTRLDKLLLDVIDPPRSAEDRIIEVINLSLKEQITPATASVAIQELVKENHIPKKTTSIRSQNNSAYTASSQIREMEKQGWNQ